MEQFIGCDAHKRFSVFVAVNEKGRASESVRVVHDRQLYREFLGRLPPRSEIAVEAGGSYSWLVDEMECSGHCPRLCNPLEAKRRIRDQRELKRLGTYSPDGRVIASRESRGRLFRRRTGQRGYPTSP